MTVTMTEKEAFGYWVTQWQLAPRTRETYITVISSFIDYLNNRELNQELVNRYMKDHPRSYHKSALKKYFEFKKRDDLNIPRVKANPRKIIKIPPYDDFKPILDKMLSFKKATMDHYYVSLVMFKTGCRVHEALCLKVSNFDFSNGSIKFKKTKTGKERDIAVPEEEMGALKDFLVRQKGLLAGQKAFYTNYKDQVDYQEFRNVVDDLVKRKILNEKEGILLKNTHNFRRAWTRMLKQKVKDVYAVQLARGDEDIRNTILYLGELEEEEAMKDVNEALIS